MDNVSELVSIIMAAYNAEKTIETAIQSVISQTYTHWELIVINDCSKDRTIDIVNQYAEKDSRIHLLNNEKNQGVSLTRKRGLEESNGAWIAVLDSDDLWVSDKLEKQLLLAQKENAKLIFTGSDFIDQNGNPIDWTLHVPDILSYRKLLKQNVVSNSSVLAHLPVGNGRLGGDRPFVLLLRLGLPCTVPRAFLLSGGIVLGGGLPAGGLALRRFLCLPLRLLFSGAALLAAHGLSRRRRIDEIRLVGAIRHFRAGGHAGVNASFSSEHSWLLSGQYPLQAPPFSSHRGWSFRTCGRRAAGTWW